MPNTLTIPVSNRSASDATLGLEPEGDVIVLKPGEACQLVLVAEAHLSPTFEVVLDDGLISFFSDAQKEVWRGNQQIR